MIKAGINFTGSQGVRRYSPHLFVAGFYETRWSLRKPPGQKAYARVVFRDKGYKKQTESLERPRCSLNLNLNCHEKKLHLRCQFAVIDIIHQRGYITEIQLAQNIIAVYFHRFDRYIDIISDLAGRKSLFKKTDDLEFPPGK